jgi:hypothetical protein
MIPNEAWPRLKSNLGYAIGPPSLRLEHFPAYGAFRLPDRLDRPICTYNIEVIVPRGQLELAPVAVCGGRATQGDCVEITGIGDHFSVELDTGIEGGRHFFVKASLALTAFCE